MNGKIVNGIRIAEKFVTGFEEIPDAALQEFSSIPEVQEEINKRNSISRINKKLRIIKKKEALRNFVV